MKIIDQGMNRETAIKAINANLAELGKGQRIDRGMNDKTVRSMLVAAGLPFNRRNRRAVLAGLNLVFSTPQGVYLPTGAGFPLPQYAVGMGKLLPGYAGPAATVSKIGADATVMDIPNGPDLADLTGLIAFGDARVANLYDQAWVVNGGAAGAADFIQATAGSRPPIRVSNLSNGKPTISMGLDSTGRSATGSHLRNASVVNQRQSVTHFWVGALTGGVVNSLGLWGIGSDANAANGLQMIYDNTNQQPSLYPLTHSFGGGITGPSVGQLVVMTTVSSASGVVTRINGVQVASKAAATALELVGATIGRGVWSAALLGSSDFAAAVNYNTVLTAGQIDAVEAALADKFDVTLGVNPNLLSWEGDSLTAAMNESGWHLGLQRQLSEALQAEGKRTPNMPTFAVAGDTAANVYAQRDTNWTQSSNKGATKLAHHIWVGTNDIAALASGAIVGGAATIWANSIQPYIAAQAAVGRFGTGRVIVGTIIPRGWTGTAQDRAEREAERLALNTLIRDNAAAMGYLVADYGAVAQLAGAPSGGNPNYPNLTYYGAASDIHINAAGYALLLAVLLPIVKAIFY